MKRHKGSEADLASEAVTYERHIIRKAQEAQATHGRRVGWRRGIVECIALSNLGDISENL